MPRATTVEADGRFGATWPRNPGAALSLPFTVRFRRLHLRVVPEPQVVRRHRHDELELLLPSAGSWRGAVNGKALEVPAGGALLVAPGDIHEDRCLEPLALHGIELELLPGPKPGISASPLAADAPVACRRLAAAPTLHAIAARLTEATRLGGRWTTVRQDALTHELLVELLALLPPAALAPAVSERIAADGFGTELAAILAANPRGIAVGALAAALGLSERGLQQRCRTLLGETPLALISRQRMALAQALLATGSTVTAVAEHLGFANPFHFSTAYKRAYGHPPSRMVRESEGRERPRAWLDDGGGADSAG